MSHVSNTRHHNRYHFCAVPDWTVNEDHSNCPLPSLSATGTTFTHSLEPSDALEVESDRFGTALTAAVNVNLTVGLPYSFAPPRSSDSEIVWRRILTHYAGNVSYRLVVRGPDDVIVAIAAKSVLINTQTGLVLAVPSEPFVQVSLRLPFACFT